MTTPSPQSAEAQEREALLPCPFCDCTNIAICGTPERGYYAICEACSVATCEVDAGTQAGAAMRWNRRASLPSAAASGEASAVQEAEAPNFCARCGKRLGAGIHTCSLPRGAAVEGLTDSDIEQVFADNGRHSEEGDEAGYMRVDREDAIRIGRALLAAQSNRCPHCDDTGDVHGIDGEWRGRCTCPAASPVPEALTFDLKTTVREYVADQTTAVLMDEWTRGFEECKRRIHKMLTAPHNQGRVLAPVPMASSIRIDFKQATDLLVMFGGEPTEITLMNATGEQAHSGPGLYAYYTDLPEEGSIHLGVTDEEAEPMASSAGEPEGWKLVPIKPTEHMLFKMAECDGYLRGDRDHPMLTQWEDYWNMAIEASPIPPAASLREQELEAEVARLNAIINSPQSDDFIRAVSTEAEHQRQRWGADGDAGKTPADWFWLVGYLAGKALHSHAAGNAEKAEHHVITTAAACANWHRAIFGKTNMRPGHEEGLDAQRLGRGKENGNG
jgi:hypothetical protein